MKKILSLMLALFVVGGCFAACGKKEKEHVSEEPVISYETIVKSNRRQDLAKKYGCVTEYIENKNTKNGNDITWTMSYEYDKNAEDYYNILIDMGDAYRSYYYDGNIYAENNGIMSYVINYREEYKNVLHNAMLFSTRLNYKFYQTVYAKKIPTGYETKYTLKADGETADEFYDWGVKPNDEIHILFKINQKKEISEYTYYLVKNNKEIEMAKISYKFGGKIDFPESIKNPGVTHIVNIFENYGSSNNYKESYEVPDGFMLSVNNNLGAYDAYINPQKTKVWHFAEDYVTKNTNLYLENFSKGRSHTTYGGMEN